MIIEPTPNAETYFLDSEPTSANPALGRKVDAIRSVLSVTQIRGISEQRRERLKELDLRDTEARLRTAFAEYISGTLTAYLGLWAASVVIRHIPMPSDAFLSDHGARIYNAIIGVTREPQKVPR